MTYDTVNLRFDAIALPTTVPAIQAGLVNFEIANNRVIKNLSLYELTNAFDKNIGSTNDSTIELETDIVIPPLLNFVCQVQIPYYAGVANTYLRCIINGAESNIKFLRCRGNCKIWVFNQGRSDSDNRSSKFFLF